MPTVRWRLADYLNSHKLTAYALTKEIGLTRMNTIYRLARRGSEPVRVDLPTLALVISGLRSLTSEDVQLADILEYDPVGEIEAKGTPSTSSRPEDQQQKAETALQQLRALNLSDEQLDTLIRQLRS